MITLEHVKEAIKKTEDECSKLSDGTSTSKEILNLIGMSSYKVRHLLNNLCSVGRINYLEIGTWLGSTLCSAAYKNDLNIYACDNWGEFRGSEAKSIFNGNIKKYISSTNNFVFFDKDCFEIDLSEIKHKIDFYLYDGAHDLHSQKKSITYFEPVFNDKVVILVDDYGDDPPPSIGSFEFRRPHGVREGTRLGLAQLKDFNVVYTKELPPYVKYSEPDIKKDYWCGQFLIFLEKKC